MPSIMEITLEDLRISLRAARENERRWLEMSPDVSFDNERMEQWSSVAQLRRQEVLRIETLLAPMEESSILAQSIVPLSAF